MSAKHTPGPWAHDTSGHPAPDVRAASGRAIAHTWMVCSSTPKSASGYQARADEDRANARLISAAPDLLAALQSVVRQIEPLLDKQGFAYCGAIQSARKAIAQATGEAA